MSHCQFSLLTLSTMCHIKGTVSRSRFCLLFNVIEIYVNLMSGKTTKLTKNATGMSFLNMGIISTHINLYIHTPKEKRRVTHTHTNIYT